MVSEEGRRHAAADARLTRGATSRRVGLNYGNGYSYGYSSNALSKHLVSPKRLSGRTTHTLENSTRLEALHIPHRNLRVRVSQPMNWFKKPDKFFISWQGTKTSPLNYIFEYFSYLKYLINIFPIQYCESINNISRPNSSYYLTFSWDFWI